MGFYNRPDTSGYGDRQMQRYVSGHESQYATISRRRPEPKTKPIEQKTEWWNDPKDWRNS